MTSFSKSDFSIGHRGACMQYPEHTIESYKAAALMGAGIIECDVTFTKDRELICKDPRILRINFIHGDFRKSHIDSNLTLSTFND